MSQSMTRTDTAVEKFAEQPLVEKAWAADDGYVVVVLDRAMQEHGSIFQLLDLADHLDMDGRIRMYDDWLVDGEERDAVHFEHVSRTEDGR